MSGVFVIRGEVHNNSIRDGVDDVKDTRKIDVSKVRVVYRDLVVLGLIIVDLGNTLSLRRLI